MTVPTAAEAAAAEFGVADPVASDRVHALAAHTHVATSNAIVERVVPTMMCPPGLRPIPTAGQTTLSVNRVSTSDELTEGGRVVT
jgi:hypothetical protein